MKSTLRSGLTWAAAASGRPILAEEAEEWLVEIPRKLDCLHNFCILLRDPVRVVEKARVLDTMRSRVEVLERPMVDGIVAEEIICS